ncbi:helix-turn-helix transcriptional regulator [Paractinoplanes lichenicola]|uniref:AAA family ATPase n=1 Tax=Paractinoplanes lichenicola TaxID=2802976 RepID=A0ABS1VLK7_9ACTN|nr:AAA family ATPase [Actinoplanes lichenicola]MBL7255530.1 AAA family ATPase [Actinoplanes lichenicola]
MEQGRDLVGRDAELAVLAAALDGAGARTLVIAGEPGIGKSRLLAELGRMADERGLLVLDGSASEFERDLPFWLFVDALDEYLRAARPELDDETEAELARLLPSWPAPASEGRGDPRYRAHRAVRQVLEVLARATPTVLLLDDLHWADEGSVELLCALLRRPPAAPVLLGLAMRPRQTSGRLTAALDRAAATRLDLAPLTPEAVRELLGPRATNAARLHAESGGNPFYLTQLARTGRSPDGRTSTEDAVSTAMSDELALLDRDVRRVLEGAAVAGDPFQLELVAAAAERTEPEVADALDALLDRDLVRPTEAPRRFRFRHPLLRRAVYDAAPRAWRVGAHERLGRALAERGVPPAGRAHHIVQAARPGDPEAVALLREAGDDVLLPAPGEAARWYRHALDLRPGDPELWAALGQALGGAGRLAEARDALVRALALLPEEDLAARVPLIAECAGIEHTLGRHDAAHRRLTAALAQAGEDRPAEAATLMCAIAQDHQFRLEFTAAVQWSRRARAAAGRLGDPRVIAETSMRLGFSAAFAGLEADAVAACAEAAALLDAQTDEEIGHSADPIVGQLAAAELLAGRLSDAARHAERALAVVSHHVPVMYWAGLVRAARGRLPEAAAVLDEAIEVARSSGNPSLLGWTLLARATVATTSGDTARARTLAEECVEAHGGEAHTLPGVWSRLTLATTLADAGEPAAAERLLTTLTGAGEPAAAERLVTTLTGAGEPAAAEQMTEGDALDALPAPLRPAARELLVRCCLAAGRVAEAAALAGDTGRPAAAAALAQGRPHEAAELALAEAATSAGPTDEAASRFLAARALAEADQPEAAVRELQLVCDLYERCGAPRRRAEAERLMRRLGHRRVHHRSGPGSGLAGLTGRELEIARLITDRRTNAEIAEALFLSTKTVETHIRNVFHKLSVTSRVEIARAVERHDGG